MDRRDAMAMSGSAAFYMQRGMAGSGPPSGLNVSSPMNPLSNASLQFQSNIGAATMGSTLPMENSPAMSPRSVNVGAPMVPLSEPIKRKRGRPRKYGPDASASLALSSPLSAAHRRSGTVTPSTQKRGRGRPPGSGRKQQLASLGGWLSGSAGIGFTPHVITVAVGEDIATKVVAFSQQGPRAICILSANGAVSSVTLRQPSTSGGTVTYEGRFEILCLSGSYLVTNGDGALNRSGGLSVSLASPDGQVIGGGIGGMLIAASPVQIILGSFVLGSSKVKVRKNGGHAGGGEVDNQMVEHAATPNTVQQSQNLPPATSVSVWPGSRPLDMRDTHVDIDLMRG